MTAPYISFIIPAHNEELLVARTIESIQGSARRAGATFEIIVVDDASTDRTAEIARSCGAEVMRVELRHIAAVRNAGARQARGEAIVFVDADTIIPPPTVQRVLHAIENGAVGGSAPVRFDGRLPFLGWLAYQLFLLTWSPMGLGVGAIMFARRDVFERIGGFDERYFAGEEVWLTFALRSRGRFVILRGPVLTSGRKVRMYSQWQLLKWVMALIVSGPRGWQKREGLELWYEGRRER